MAWTAREREGYGRGEATIEDDRSVSDHLEIRLRHILLERDYTPPILPSVAMSLMDMARKPDVAFKDVLALLEQEPTLAGRVLAVAQSSLYTRGQPVRTLEQALTRLGLSTLSHIFMQVVVTAKVFRVPQYTGPMEALRKHSVLVAHASRLICRATALDAEMAFLCGLLHDVGFALGMMEVAAMYRDKVLPFEVAKPALVEIHEKVATMVARSWRLPPEVALVLAHHHDPVVEGRTHPLAAAIQLADTWASELGFAAPGERTFLGHTTLPTLDLGERDLGRIRASVELVAERID